MLPHTLSLSFSIPHTHGTDEQTNGRDGAHTHIKYICIIVFVSPYIQALYSLSLANRLRWHDKRYLYIVFNGLSRSLPYCVPCVERWPYTRSNEAVSCIRFLKQMPSKVSKNIGTEKKTKHTHTHIMSLNEYAEEMNRAQRTATYSQQKNTLAHSYKHTTTNHSSDSI